MKAATRNELRNALGAAPAAAAIAMLLVFGSIGTHLRQLDKRTQRTLSLAHSYDAQHDRELVGIYEKAILSSIYNGGYSIGNLLVACDTTRIVP